MLDLCPICQFPLYNGEDSKQYIEYPEEQLQRFYPKKLTDEAFVVLADKLKVDEMTLAEFKTEIERAYTGDITLAELNQSAIVCYNRPRLCTNKGNNDTMTGADGTVQINPPCPNYCGEDRSNPVKVVEWIKIIDN